jgi:O-succinylhomoserine sulfhydrylase
MIEETMMTDKQEWGQATLAIRTGHRRTAEGEHSEPIFPTSSFVFASAEEAAARFSGEAHGNIYSRFTNPTVAVFEERLAALEGGESCVATASGMAAILAVCMGLLQHGDHIVSSRSIFGTTKILFSKYLERFGIATTFVDLTDPQAWREALQDNTRMLFLETPSNPLTEIGDIAKLAEIAHQQHAVLVVDNCFCTPALQRPLELGADVVVHSATKYIDGQGRCMGGAVVGDRERVGEEVYGVLRTAGPTMSPFSAWVFLKGLETLQLRMRQHCCNAQTLAEWLEAHPRVERVFYPGLESHPQKGLMQQQQSAAGGILSFELRGGQQAAWRLMDRQRLMSITANLGDAKTTVTHPGSTTHSRLSEEERAASGITAGLLRISVGLENVEDLIADLESALRQ